MCAYSVHVLLLPTAGTPGDTTPAVWQFAGASPAPTRFASSNDVSRSALTSGMSGLSSPSRSGSLPSLRTSLRSSDSRVSTGRGAGAAWLATVPAAGQSPGRKSK